MSADSNTFRGKVAFITGGGSGIGRATATAFARAGAAVAVVDRNESGAQETARLISDSGGRAVAIRCDVTQESEVDAAVARTVTEFDRLDAAFNNAGVEHPVVPTHEIDAATYDHILGVNLRGVYLCMKAQIPVMLGQGSGTIVNTSSGAGLKGIFGQAVYCASKWGVIGLTRSAALEYADTGLRINSIAPGIVNTPMMDRFSGGTNEGRDRVIGLEPIGRMGSPEEIADSVLWLSSDASSYVLGVTLPVDGGFAT